MYIVFVALSMVVLPVASILVNLAHVPDAGLMELLGRWFVFWGVGVRLGVAGLRQFLWPKLTATEVFHMTSDQALPVIRELGIANVGTAVIALTSLAIPGFVLPAALSAGIFYGMAAVGHIAEPNRSLNENVALWSDLFLFSVLLAVVVAAVAGMV